MYLIITIPEPPAAPAPPGLDPPPPPVLAVPAVFDAPPPPAGGPCDALPGPGVPDPPPARYLVLETGPGVP